MMTIASVLLNFRTALLAIVPAVERAGISWKRPDAYDEWDAIATTVFDKLVIEVLRWSLPEEERESFRGPSLGKTAGRTGLQLQLVGGYQPVSVCGSERVGAHPDVHTMEAWRFFALDGLPLLPTGFPACFGIVDRR